MWAAVELHDDRGESRHTVNDPPRAYEYRDRARWDTLGHPKSVVDVDVGLGLYLDLLLLLLYVRL